MAFLSPTGHLPTENVDEEPFRFTRNLPLISTKLTPPRTPGVVLQRDRLLTRLDNAASGSLTLVCAAAGFGKTTLLSQWYQHRQAQGDALAWLSLEEEDSTPLLFMRYLLAALSPLYPGWSDTFQRYPEGAHPGDFSLFLAELVNQLHRCSHPLYLILDDYQSIRSREIHDGLTWLLQHAPAALHLVIGSRNRLPLVLSRLRLWEQYTEIEDSELRFNDAEAQAYFARSVTPPVNTRDIPQLRTLTEGWVAGMKIAALSPRRHDAMPGIGGVLSGGSRSISRYLEEVIFAPLPASVLHFLMLTSLLNRLHPALCDAVTGLNNGKEMLAWIEQHNLFLSALDEAGFWFRYHPLMRDALSHRLQQDATIDIRQLHERAGNWFAAQQLWAEAIRHALAAGKSLARHAEAGAQSLAEEGDIDTMVRWIHHLPATPDPSRIELQLNLAWALAHHCRFSDARQLLDAIEAMVTTRAEHLPRSTWVKQRVVRAICEAFADNISGSLPLVEPLLNEVPCGDIWVDGLVCNILSYCHLALAHPQRALEVQQHVSGNQATNRNLFVEVYRVFVLALGQLRQGDLQEAERQAIQALHHAEHHTGQNSSSGATLAPLLAEIAWERGDSERVNSLLNLRLGMIDDFCPSDGLSLCYVVLARQAQLNAQPDEAMTLLRHAGQLCRDRGWWRARIALLAEETILHLNTGKKDNARRQFALLQQLASEPRAVENRVVGWHRGICESRLLLAEGDALTAAATLTPVINEQERCGEWLAATRLRIQQAVAFWQAGDEKQAMAACVPALPRAVAQNMQRTLLDGGSPLLALLSRLREQSQFDTALTAVIASAGAMLMSGGIPPLPTHKAATQGLRLTEREQQILQLIAEGHSNKGIARTLGISVETVKWHLKQLYEKLAVSGRIQAVNRARKLGLMG